MQTLLIVEDEKLIRQGIRVMVERSGVPVERIIECSNGEKALEVLKTEKVDVVFTDIRMPKMDGIALVKAMRGLPQMPFTVAISGYDDFSYAVEMLRGGVFEYLLKPVDREKVKEVLERLNARLEEKMVLEKQDRGTFCQQLKYLILNDKLTSEELQQMKDRYEDNFFGKEYVVICGADSGRALGECTKDGYNYLRDVDGQELYITTDDMLETLLSEELTERVVGISAKHTGIEELKEAYEEAFFSRKEAFYLGKDRVWFEEAVMHRDPTLRIEESTISHIVQLLGTDKYQDAIKQLQKIFKNASLGGYCFRDIELGMRFLLDGMFATYSSVLSMQKEEMQEYYSIYGYETLEEYQTEMLGWVEEFCDTLKNRFDDYKNKQKINAAIAFIRENYHKDLNMAVVSNHISMNYSLFSFVFKQYTGTNFVNYLKEIRIKEAMRLLETTDMKVIEISEQVGYDNEKHFMKIFKSVTGVSPTEYRKNAQYR